VFLLAGDAVLAFRLRLARAPSVVENRNIRRAAVSFWVNSLSVGIVLGTPLAYAALGELIAERAGVITLASRA